MFPKPSPRLSPNTYAYESRPMVKPTGFREYDARWMFEQEINLMGAQALGLGLARLLKELGVEREIVVGHDFRSYSASIKLAMTAGLMAGGAEVRDIGLAITPMAYFAQFALDTPAVAMVTASHNDNGWTGVKMGASRPVTFGPEEMARLRDIVIAGDYGQEAGGGYEFVPDFPARYIADLTARPKFSRSLKVVAACGNGTAGAFAPKLLSALGVEVVPLDCDLDFTFPHYNPNPEDMQMLHAMAAAVKETGADLALGFDGDGDRCGVVDNEGARDLRRQDRGHAGARPLDAAQERDLRRRRQVDRAVRDRSRASGQWRQGRLLEDRPFAHQAPGPRPERPRRASRSRAIFSSTRRSGAAMTTVSSPRSPSSTCWTGNPDKSMADLYRDLPKTWGSPTMSPHCADEAKYAVADRVVERLQGDAGAGEPLAGQPIRDLVTVNGVRVTVEDGTWGLVRASSNKPELVVVVESPASEARHAGDVRGGRPDLAREPRSRGLQPDDLMGEAPNVAAHVLPDLLKPGLRIVFCGTAAGTVVGGARRLLRPSAEPVLVGAPRLRADAAKAQAGRLCRIAAMGLGAHRHRQARERHGSRVAAGRAWRGACAALEAKIMAAEPEWLAFTSLTAGRRYLRRAAGFGEQPERIGRTRLWLLPSPSPTAGWNWESNTHWWRMLADEASLEEPVVARQIKTSKSK